MNDALLQRYSRQLVLPEVDFIGQKAIENARIGIVGMGGLGSIAALYLAGAGVNFLRLFDYDHIEVSNLHRQIAYRETDIGEAKAIVAARECQKLNRHGQVEAIHQKLSESEMGLHLSDLDLILDGTDNFKSRFALNRLSVQYRKPLVMGAAIQWAGQWALYQGYLETAPCYACVFPEFAQEQRVSCQEVGVMGPVAGMVGNMMALMALQFLLKTPQPPVLHHFDGTTHSLKRIPLSKDPSCAVCLRHPVI